LLCGNGLLNGDEECDDENNDDFDGCSSTCELEPGWDCGEDLPTECSSTCGDGAPALGAEECDDENTDADDGCSDTCVVEEGWMCAPEGDDLPDVCEGILNDGLIRGGEICDDGNDVSGDGCHDGLVEDEFVCDGEPSVCEEDHGHDDEDAGDVPGDGPAPDTGTPDAGDTGDAGDVGPGDVSGDEGDEDTSEPEDSGCCRTASAGHGPEAALWALALGVGLIVRRRR
jgi:MYXO-CTERM domain-containing protein